MLAATLLLIAALESAFSSALYAADAPIQVAVSVPPQAYFVERIAGEAVSVEVLIPPSASHETYAPSPRQIVALERARLYVKVGHPQFLFERQYIDPFLGSHPGIRVVNMSAGIDFIPAAEHEPIEGAQGADIHVWLAPYTVRVAAQNIARALEDLDPARQAQYRANLARFLADIDALDKDIRAMLSNLKQRKFMIYHPAFGYFAKQYGLIQIAIETEGKEPSPPRLISLIQEARRDGIRTVFVEKGYSTKSAQVIAREIGGQVVELDPMAHDWLANMRRVAEVLSRSLDHG